MAKTERDVEEEQQIAEAQRLSKALSDVSSLRPEDYGKLMQMFKDVEEMQWKHTPASISACITRESLLGRSLNECRSRLTTLADCAQGDIKACQIINSVYAHNFNVFLVDLLWRSLEMEGVLQRQYPDLDTAKEVIQDSIGNGIGKFSDVFKAWSSAGFPGYDKDDPYSIILQLMTNQVLENDSKIETRNKPITYTLDYQSESGTETAEKIGHLLAKYYGDDKTFEFLDFMKKAGFSDSDRYKVLAEFQSSRKYFAGDEEREAYFAKLQSRKVKPTPKMWKEYGTKPLYGV